MLTLLLLAAVIFVLQLYLGELSYRGKCVTVRKGVLQPYLEELAEYLTEEYVLPVVVGLILLNQDVEPVQEYVQYVGGLLRSEAFRLETAGLLPYPLYALFLCKSWMNPDPDEGNCPIAPAIKWIRSARSRIETALSAVKTEFAGKINFNDDNNLLDWAASVPDPTYEKVCHI